MLLGPLFLWELVRTSRRTGRWWIRVAYSCILLLLLGAAVNRSRAASPVYRDSPRWLADVASRFYPSFATSQLAAVLLFGPVFAVSIVEEKTRSTLPFLLASRLTDWEIVFSKFAMAWLRVFEVLASGLPFAAICLLLGGITPEVVFADFAVCLAAAWASCALAVLGSVSCRRLLDVLLAVYLAQLLWYTLPVVALVAGAVGYPLGVPDWVLRINGFRAMASAWSPGSVRWWDSYGLSIAAMLVFGLSCELGGWYLLRGFAERFLTSAGRSHGLFRWFYRTRSGAEATVWDRAVLWRELRCRRTRGMEFAVWCLTVVAGGTVLAVIAWEWKTTNLQRAMGTGPPALGVIAALSTFCHLSFLALPYLAVAGATAFAEERDRRLMDSLRVTDLEQRELVRAKAIRLMRVWAGMMLLPILLILCLASVRWTSPTGCLLMAGRCLSSGTFAAMLGLAVGLRARSTFQAILVTLVTGLIGGFFIPLAAFGVGPGVVGYTILTVSPPVHCYLLAFQESPLGPPGAISIAELRYVAAAWTTAFAVASVLLYRLSLAPAGPWREPLGDASW